MPELIPAVTPAHIAARLRWLVREQPLAGRRLIDERIRAGLTLEEARALYRETRDAIRAAEGAGA